LAWWEIYYNKIKELLNLEKAVEIVMIAPRMLKMAIIFENFSEAVLTSTVRKNFQK